MLGTRKPVEDLRAATKMELTSGTSGGPVTVTKPSSYAIPSSVTAPLLAHTWKSSGFSQCSASCLGGISIDFSFLYTVGHCSFNGTLFLTLSTTVSLLYIINTETLQLQLLLRWILATFLTSPLFLCLYLL